MVKRALILVDIQNDYFPGGAWPVEGMEAAAAKAAVVLQAARRAGELAVHVRHEATSAEAPFFRPGSEGSEINAAVVPAEGEAVLVKHRPNSFLNTGLEVVLREAGIEAVTVCGAMSQMCVDATARAAADLGFAVTVVADACGARAMSFDGVEVPAPQVHAAFMAALGSSYARVVAVEAYLAG